MKKISSLVKIIPAFTLAGIVSPILAKKVDKRPNVVIFLADDLGSSDVSFAGCKDYQTPNIDRIANEGVQCTQAYVCATYSGPSRCGLNTGRYQQRFGAEMNLGARMDSEDGEALGVPLDELMLSELLHNNGYTTCAVGKWHMGDDPKLWPNKRGFDYFFGFSGGGFNYRGTPSKAKTPEGAPKFIQENGVEVPASKITYLTDDFTDKTVDFINKNAHGEKPMYMYVAYNAPHAPHQATKQYLDQTKHIFNAERSIIAAMILGVDNGVKRIREALEKNGVADNTIMIFLSDNGGTPESSNYPRRAYKGNMFDGGTYTPFAMSWPGHILPGSKYNKVISSLDIFPTIAAAAGIDTKKECKKPLDGVNLMPYLSGENNGEPNHKLFWRVVDGFEYAARIGDYKLVKRYYSDVPLLFNMVKDPIEQYDISSQHPELVKSMMEEYNIWNKGNIHSKWLDPHEEHQIKDYKKWSERRAKATITPKKNK